MKLKDVELLPGVVVANDDPNNRGRVKAVVPGVFDTSVMSIEGMPWIYPLTMGHDQSFSKMTIGSKIWLFKIENNFKEFWYIPMFQLNDDVSEIIGYDNADVLFHRSVESNSANISYTENDGIDMSVGSDTKINISNDDNINIKTANASVTVGGGKVKIGNDDANEPLVKGEQLKTLLENLSTNIHELAASAAECSDKTGHLFEKIQNMSVQLDTDMNNLLSDFAFVS